MTKINSKQLAEALYQSLTDKKPKDVDKILGNFVEFLAKKRLIGQSSRIIKSLQAILAKNSGVYILTLRSARTLDEKVISKVRKDFMKKLEAKELEINQQTDSTLVGGYRVEVMDMVYDFSVSSALDKFRSVLITDNK